MIEYENKQLSAKVILEDKAYKKLCRALEKCGLVETGGILIGYYDVSCKKAIITEVTDAPKDSRSGRNWFARGTLGLKQLLKIKWKIEEYYLGEWHIHPQSSPFPSITDINQMKHISKDLGYNCKEPLLLIIGNRYDKPEIYLALIIENNVYVMEEVYCN